MTDTAQTFMPKQNPLIMPQQDFQKPYAGKRAPIAPKHTHNWAWKSAIFGPAILTTGLLLAAFTDWLSTGGLGWLEFFLITFVGLTFFWVSLSVSTATAGLITLITKGRSEDTGGPSEPDPMDVALLVPVYNENPSDVFGNAAAMLEELRLTDTKHSFSLFILSDTQDPNIALQELRAMNSLRSTFSNDARIYYRRREQNTDRKTGNLTDWIEGWGGGSEAMLVLDADSLMSGQAIVSLADEMSRDPSAGLIQSCPELFGAETLFARMQQFSNVTYGRLLTEGLALWTNREGNYWGHNAIIRTVAFASSAGLPYLKSLGGKDALILSHDFVEAGLLRRAGWAVRFLPHIQGSYEETPATLIDFALRDRRWCQGNLQHLRILAATGLHTVSRFHLLHGAISYLLSPAWFILLLIWAVLGNGDDANVINYFSATNPTMPIWPHISTVNSMLILLFMYSMLLAPKIIGASVILASPTMRHAYGGNLQFCASFLTEIITSIAYAPILMVQQTVAVIRSVIGYREAWNPQKRNGSYYPLSSLVKFHILELIAGFALLAGMFAGIVSLWLLPIAFSLSASVFLSALSGVNLTHRNWSRWQLKTPLDISTPRVIVLSSVYRSQIQASLESAKTSQIPAE